MEIVIIPWNTKSASSAAQEHARAILDKLVAQGAIFTFLPAANSLPPTFTYTLPLGSDRWRCRGLILDAKANPAVWHELVAEIGRRCQGGAE